MVLGNVIYWALTMRWHRTLAKPMRKMLNFRRAGPGLVGKLPRPRGPPHKVQRHGWRATHWLRGARAGAVNADLLLLLAPELGGAVPCSPWNIELLMLMLLL